MVAIQPFCALRYDLERGLDLSQVIAPPYDVISPEEQERLHQRSPYNVVRLTLGKASSADTDADNRYTRARAAFDQWRREGILRQDRHPTLYLLEQAFADAGRTQTRLGFLALLAFEGAAEGRVFRHEATLAAPKADRTKLLEAVPASLEPIFCVFPDEGGSIQALLREWSRSAPTVETVWEGRPVRLWAVTDPRAVESLTGRLASAAVLIADGHHRFEVAYAHRATHPALMSYFVSMADPALAVRPIHRLVSTPGVSAEALRRFCRMEPAGDLAALTGWLERVPEGMAGTTSRFGYYDGKGLFQASVSPEAAAQWLIAPPVPLPVAALDVAVLHGLILPGIGLRDGAAVRYEADAAQAVASVDRGKASSAWLLRGIPLSQVYALASQGMSLPPKSTYFYPKVPSGLAFHLFG